MILSSISWFYRILWLLILFESQLSVNQHLKKPAIVAAQSSRRLLCSLLAAGSFAVLHVADVRYGKVLWHDRSF